VANLDEQLAAHMRERVEKLADVRFDRVHIFELCQACADRTRTVGTAEVVKDRDFYVI
jgi:CRISPR/Cas system-associated endoribonuclease Cas2